MLQHVFATMNDLLDDIIRQYPHAQGKEKKELDHQMSLLRSMSDLIVEEWLQFEEKLAQLRPRGKDASGGKMKKEQEISAPDYGDPFQRGQGYYLLMMYKEAVKHLEQAALHQPDNIEVRAYLAMAYLNMGRSQEAGHHFEFIIPLTESKCLKAIAYNALGCIQAEQRNLSLAQEYFAKAHQMDPSLPEPVFNLKVCLSNCGHLQYGAGNMNHMQ
ncbi:tetratricopeptide repeat protein [Paenibacillus sp. MER TA 81-3]|uniref:tetratricopeptide repeat protein n=1 Tax=Paenibacillus sp. MER TA 81-3 TaxID=2939573 RepID=UPI002041CB2E|nr:tetratricopeptide repeat protein [Paenibacillus sp. MER TA 81-3]MCM3341286.1 tetratricopeptide repeat protein [Paenibacillus sp. MER TA 81-3]